MALISIQNISVAFGGEPLLDNVTLIIERGERTCLMGRNGSGKTTLIKIITGQIKPDSGEIVLQPRLKVASLPQEVPTDTRGTVIEIVKSGMPKSADADPWQQDASANAAISKLGLNPNDNFVMPPVCQGRHYVEADKK